MPAAVARDPRMEAELVDKNYAMGNVQLPSGVVGGSGVAEDGIKRTNAPWCIHII